jgi:hypothetical protein
LDPIEYENESPPFTAGAVHGDKPAESAQIWRNNIAGCSRKVISWIEDNGYILHPSHDEPISVPYRPPHSDVERRELNKFPLLRLGERLAVSPGGAGLFSPHQEEADQHKHGGDVPGAAKLQGSLLDEALSAGMPSSASHSAYKRESCSREPEHVPEI